MAWRFYALAARVLVGGLFIATAYLKIDDPSTFAKEIQGYGMAPLAVTHAMALVLPWIEGLAGLLLVLSVWRAEARLLVGLMLLVFTFVKAYRYFVLGDTGSCGCGGDNVWLKMILDNPQGIVTNILLLGMLAVDRHAQRACRRGGVVRSNVPAEAPT